LLLIVKNRTIEFEALALGFIWGLIVFSLNFFVVMFLFFIYYEVLEVLNNFLKKDL
jgi:hypothetical protein